MRSFPEFTSEFAALFLDETGRVLGEAVAAFDRIAANPGAGADELAGLRSSAHSVAGSAAVLGFALAAQAARALEHDVATLMVTGESPTPAVLSRLRDAFEALGRACTSAVADDGGPVGVAKGDPMLGQPKGQQGGPLIVQIEDNAVNVLLVERIVERRPHIRIESYRDGASGINAVLAGSPQLVILDLNLPDIPGEEVLRRLRAETGLGSLPIVVSSGDVAEHRQQGALQAGADLFLGKPFGIPDFLAIIDKYCAPLPESRGGP